MVTIENISAGDEIARRTHSDGYFLNAPYEMFIKNHLGSTMTLVDENGQRVDAVYDYFPYGKQKIVASAPGAAKPVTQTYTGKELDLYTDGDVTGNDGEGRYYFGARYYDADVGRWISIDPVPQFFDLYNYCSNNPIKNIDPDGKEVEVQGTTKFKEATFASIGLMAKGQEGTDLWTQLYTSKNKFIIKETSGGNSFTGNFIQRLAMKLGIPTGGTVYYNPYKTTGGLDVKGSNIRPAFIGLGHELGHAYAADLGIQDFDMTLGVNGIPSAEQTSVFMEQMLRSENKLPLRQGY
jgi:RHS repeat-associated protein